jgi:hypothetical protein
MSRNRHCTRDFVFGFVTFSTNLLSFRVKLPSMKANKLTTKPITEPESAEPTTPAADETLMPANEVAEPEPESESEDGRISPDRRDRFTWKDSDIKWL